MTGQNVPQARLSGPNERNASFTSIDPRPAAVGGGRFVGRRQEITSLLGLLRRAERSAGCVALLEGEPGIGKTRTAEEIAHAARGRGFTVLWGRCFEGEECPAFGPWAGALRSLARSAGHDRLLQAAGDGAPDIVGILPELTPRLAGTRPEVSLTALEGESLLCSSLAACLLALSRDAPLLVVLDDLDLADAGSLKVLRHLARELPGTRLAILGSLRTLPSGGDGLLAATVGDLARTRGFMRLHLEGLAEVEVRELLGPLEGMAAAIHARTEGNPFFLIELVRQIGRERAPTGDVTALPESLRQAISRGLERLPDGCRQVLPAAAVLGRCFEGGLLSLLLDEVPEEDVALALAQATEASVITVDDPAAERYRFVHALVQETLRAGISARDLSRLHLRAARALRRWCGPDPGPRWAEILAHLLEGPLRTDSDELLACAASAAEHALGRYAPEQARGFIDRTLSTWERRGLAIEPRMAGLLHLRGRILTDLQRPVEARRDLEQAFDLYLTSGDTRRAIEVACTPAMERTGGVWLSSVADGGRGVAELRERALALAPPGSPERAWLLMQRGSRRDLEEALSSARRSGDDRLEAASLSLRAYHELLAWEFGPSEEFLEMATRLAGRLADPHLGFGCAYTRYWLGVLTGEPDSAMEAVRCLSETADRCRSRRFAAAALRCHAELAALRGDWNDAREQAGRALALVPDAQPVFNRVRALGVLMSMDLWTGDVKSATRHLDTMHRLTGYSGPADARSTILGAELAGDASLLPPSRPPAAPPDGEGPLLTFVAAGPLGGARIAALQRDRSTAAQWIEVIRCWSGTFCATSTDATLAALHDVLGRYDEAVDCYERALALCRRAGYLPDLAATCSAYADTLVRRGRPGDVDSAARLLEQVLDLCATLSLQPLARRVRERLGLLVGRPQQHQPYPDGLTSRELDVLRLVADGLTNGEIADRLFISPLTVARHVHNLLEKTGMANRAEAAAYAARAGLGHERARPTPR